MPLERSGSGDLSRSFSNAEGSEEYFRSFILPTPPFWGNEFINPDFLGQLQKELEEAVQEELSQNSVSLESFIRSLNLPGITWKKSVLTWRKI